MRSLKELYQIVLDSDYDKKYGICNIISFCAMDNIITEEEMYLVKSHFNKQKPTILSKFWWHPPYNRLYNVWWWSHTKIGANQRKLFLQYLINKL